MNACINIDRMTPSSEFTDKLADIDAHTPCIFPAHLAQGTAVNAQHRYLQFTLPSEPHFSVPIPCPTVLSSAYLKDISASVESNFLAPQSMFVPFRSLEEVKFTPASFDAVFDA